MDYRALAEEMVRKFAGLNRTEGHRQLSEFFKGEMFVLCYLAAGRDRALPGELREAMGVSSARIAATLNALERKDLIARSADADDRRRVIVSITEAGRERVRAQYLALQDKLEYMLRELGEKDAKEYIRIVGRIIEISGCMRENTVRNEEEL